MFFQSKNPVVMAGSYAVELRLPIGGLFAGEEVDVEFRITDKSKEDPVDGAPGVVRAKISGRVTMPSMASMPAAIPRIHSEGVPGDYGLVTLFPHGGDYKIALEIVPPAGKPFGVTFTVAVNDEAEPGKRKPTPKPFALQVQPGRADAGKPTTLTLTVQRRETGKPQAEFDIVHEKEFHLLIAREDLGLFFHEHPHRQPDGRFVLENFVFPTGGKWIVFGDVAPKGYGSQVLRTTLAVSGKSEKPTALVPAKTASGEGVSIALRPQKLVAGKMLALTFEISVRDLEPWLGAMAHLILIERDTTSFVHSHPDESDPKNGKTGYLTFLARFPKPGIYKGWVQFQRKGVVNTLSVVMEVGK